MYEALTDRPVVGLFFYYFESSKCGNAFRQRVSGFVTRSAMNAPAFARVVFPASNKPFCSSAYASCGDSPPSRISLGRTAQNSTTR